MNYQESGRVSVKITMLDGRSDTFPMEFVPQCYMRGGGWLPGISLEKGIEEVAELTGQDWVFEGVGYHYAEGKVIEYTIEDDDCNPIGSWQILLDGQPTTYEDIEEIAFGLYTEEE
jgi:hypothetical protein